MIWDELTEAFLEAKTPDAKLAEQKQQLAFCVYLNLISKPPVPRRLTQEFQEELAQLKADRQYPEIKPQYQLLHDGVRGILRLARKARK